MRTTKRVSDPSAANAVCVVARLYDSYANMSQVRNAVMYRRLAGVADDVLWTCDRTSSITDSAERMRCSTDSRIRGLSRLICTVRGIVVNGRSEAAVRRGLRTPPP